MDYEYGKYYYDGTGISGSTTTYSSGGGAGSGGLFTSSYTSVTNTEDPYNFNGTVWDARGQRYINEVVDAEYENTVETLRRKIKELKPVKATAKILKEPEEVVERLKAMRKERKKKNSEDTDTEFTTLECECFI